jgi:hypothetical protein
MFLIIENSVCDFGLDLLVEVLTVIDSQLDTILRGWSDAVEADEFGYFDRAEHIAGLGFVACQAYMTSTYGFISVEKSKALTSGPRHKNGQTVVEIINHAANFWKHYDEWHLDKGTARRDRIIAAFESLGSPVDLDYPLSGILAELAAPQPASFKPLADKLARWRDDLRSVSA